jgi:hypothetical protein
MIEIALTQGQIALIDDEDLVLVSQYKWHAEWNSGTKSFYARTTIRKPDGKRATLSMHRLIMNAQEGERVDHIHHLTLDNRKSELRRCNPSQNQCTRGVLVTEIELTKGQIALIDDEDFELVSKYKWCAKWSPCTGSFYAHAKTRKPDGGYYTLAMHRLVMNAQKGEQVDHIHHLTLDNRKSELRLCSPTQNRWNQGIRTSNTSGFKGVSWNKKLSRWSAQIRCNRKLIYLGLYDTPELAHEAYCKAAAELHGEFARTS